MTGTSEAQDDAGEAEALSLTFLMALERLLPVERAAFLLHQVFDRGPAETAGAIGVSDPACQQLLRRGRRVMTAARRAIDADRTYRRELRGRFLAAVRERDESRMAELLAPDAVAYLGAHQSPTVGGLRIACLLAALSPDLDVERLGISIAVGGDLVQTVTASCYAGRPGTG